MRIDAQVVIALALHRACQLLERLLLLAQPLRVLGRRVAPVQPDLGPARPERLDQARPQPVVRLGRSAVGGVAVSGHHEERRAGVPLPFDGDDSLEAPVGIGAAQPVDGDAGERAGFTERRPPAAGEGMGLEPRCRPADSDRCPAPGRVHIVRERDGERRAAPARRLCAEPRAQPLEGRVERVETRCGDRKAAVLVARAVALLDPGEVEERLCDLVPLRPLAALGLLPRLGPELDLGAGSAQRLQHPAGPRLHVHSPNAPSAYRTALTSAGFGSSAAKTPSM